MPVFLSIVLGFVAASAFPPDELGIDRWVWWGCLIVVATAAIRVFDSSLHRLTPLAMMYRMSLAFPDQTPSRFSSALRSGTVTKTKARIRAIQEGGGALEGDDAVSAQMLDLITMLSQHDRMTRGHAERVRGYSELIAEEMTISGGDLDRLRWGALLHDMGKLEVPSEILNKQGRPSEEEWAILANHPAAAERHLEPIAEWLGEWRHAADGHHERWDGSGYPNSLAGEDIPLSARIVAVADAYDVMTSVRSYKKAMTAEVARSEIAYNAGSQFDPVVARAFLRIGLGDLRRVAGPVAWFASLPAFRQVPIAPITQPVVTAVGVAVATFVSAVAGMSVDQPSEAPPSVAFVEEASITTTTLAPLPATTEPPASAAPAVVPTTTTAAPTTTTTSTAAPTTTTAAPLTTTTAAPTTTTTTTAAPTTTTTTTAAPTTTTTTAAPTTTTTTTTAAPTTTTTTTTMPTAPTTTTTTTTSTTTSTTTTLTTTTTTTAAPTTTTSATTSTTTTTTTLPPNQPPAGIPADFTVSETAPDGTLIGSLAVSDPEGDPLTVTIVPSSNPDLDGDGDSAFAATYNAAGGTIDITINDADDIDAGLNGQIETLILAIEDIANNQAPVVSTITTESRFTQSSDIGKVIISEVDWSSDGDEFVELVNVGGSNVNIGNWRIADYGYGVDAPDVKSSPTEPLAGGSWSGTFPAGTMLAPGERAIMWVNAPAEPQLAAVEASAGATGWELVRSDDIWVFDGGQALVAYMAYGDATKQDFDNEIGDRPPITAWNMWDPGFETTLGTGPIISRGDSLSLTVETVAGSQDSACWEPTESGISVGRCGGATISIDTNNRPGNFASSPGTPNT